MAHTGKRRLMPFHHKMLHLIMTLLIHGAYMESTKCPESCSCVETLISSSYKAVSLRDFDEALTPKVNPDEEDEEEFRKDLNGVDITSENLKVKNLERFGERKRCGDKGGDNFRVKSEEISESSGLKSERTKRTVNFGDKINLNETKTKVDEKEKKIVEGEKPSGSDRSKDVFTYQITCVGLRDMKSVWIQYLPDPATELNIQRANFQSFKAFQQIIKESSTELSQLTVLSVSDSIINQNPDRSYSVKTKPTNKREMAGKGKHSEFLPFASLQNPKPRSKSDVKFSSDGKSTNLQVLNLTNSTIVYLPQDTFHPFINLQILNLSNNFIQFIENETFGCLVNLLHLDVHNNRIQSLNEIIFKNLTKLILLDVSNNLLTSIEPTTFQYLSSLNVLNLASNPLSEKQEAVVLLGTGKRLQVVDISRTGLKQIPGTLERSVRVLNLTGNLLLSIRCGDLDSYSLLSYLNLKSNKISYVEDDALGRLEFLKNLQISENNLFQIPKILPNNLEILNLSFNNIQNITNADFLNLSSLKQLSLSYNQISTIEENAFDGLLHLKVLDLSRNPVLVLPPIYPKIKLLLLDLSYLTNMPESVIGRYKQFPVRGPQRIRHLNLESSPVLTKIFLQDTKTLQLFDNLKDLNLRFTNLTTIRKDIFSLLPKLTVMKVEGNPWHCTRQILPLSDWLRSHEVEEEPRTEDEVNTAHCLTPPQLYKTNLITLGEKDFGEDQRKGRESVRTKASVIINRLNLRVGATNNSENISANEQSTVKRVNMKGYKNNSKNINQLSDNKTRTGTPKDCCGNADRNGTSSAVVDAPSTDRTTDLRGTPTEGNINNTTTTTSTEFPVNNSLDLKSRQVSLLAVKKAQAVASEDTLSLKKDYNSHLSFLILSSIGLLIMATLTFTSLYFSRTRRDQNYQRQNQDIEVCSISSWRNELW